MKRPLVRLDYARADMKGNLTLLNATAIGLGILTCLLDVIFWPFWPDSNFSLSTVLLAPAAAIAGMIIGLGAVSAENASYFAFRLCAIGLLGSIPTIGIGILLGMLPRC